MKTIAADVYTCTYHYGIYNAICGVMLLHHVTFLWAHPPAAPTYDTTGLVRPVLPG